MVHYNDYTLMCPVTAVQNHCFRNEHTLYALRSREGVAQLCEYKGMYGLLWRFKCIVIFFIPVEFDINQRYAVKIPVCESKHSHLHTQFNLWQKVSNVE